MVKCCVPYCKNRSDVNKTVRYFKFPLDKRTKMKWLRLIRRTDFIPNKNSRVCSWHFLQGKAAGPERFAWNEGETSLNSCSQSSVDKGDIDGSKKKSVEDEKPQDQDDSIAYPAGEGIEIHWPNPCFFKALHTDLQLLYTDLQAKVDSLQAKNFQLKEDLHRLVPRFSYASLLGDDAQLMYLTGLHSLVFNWLVVQTATSIPKVHPELNEQDHLLLVLMKMKLGLCDTDLGYRFKIEKHSVAAICEMWIPSLASALKTLIVWQSAETVATNRPSIFQGIFSRCTGVIDCLSFVILQTDQTTPLRTVKYFVSVTPAGTVSFLSSRFSEVMTRNHIAKNCGFLGMVREQDEYVSRKRFLIKNELNSLGATLHTPNYVSGKLTPKNDAEKMFWAHVKKGMEWWKDYGMLQKHIPEEYGYLLDFVLIICAAIHNVNLSVFPKGIPKD